MSKLVLHVDGGARGNPGPAAAGVVLREDSGRTLLAAGYLLGEMTNNQAEYSALLIGLRAAMGHEVDELQIFGDSELIVRQVLGEYRVKSPELRPLFEDAQRLLLKIQNWHIGYVPREKNREADALVNRALDVSDDVVEVQESSVIPVLTQVGVTHSTPSVGLKTKRVHVELKLVHAEGSETCPHECLSGHAFLLGDLVPDGLCLYAAATALGTVVRMKSSDYPEHQAVLQCDHPGCDMEIHLRTVTSG